jgi:hypothetical protein
MIDRAARYLLEIYEPGEALKFAARAIADNRASRPATAAEWEHVLEILRAPERVAEILHDIERVGGPPEHDL